MQHQPRAERLREEDRVARRCRALRPDAVGMRGADHRQPVLRLGIADRVASGEQRSCRADGLVGSGENVGEHARRQLLRKRGHREREQRRAAHREDVVERVRGGDGAEVAGIVDDGREEVDREDERALVVELVDGRVVRRAEPDEEVLRLRRDEAREQLLETPRRVLRCAAARRDELRELHLAGGHARTVRVRENQTVARSALVTGGSRGIGLAIARMLAEEGFALTLAARNAERVEAAADELGALAVTADVVQGRGLRAGRGGARRASRRPRRPRQLGRHRHRRQRRDADARSTSTSSST